jgi:predicted PurR-regulated permease PerM
VAEVVTVAILSLFLTFFVLQDGDKAWAWLLQGTAPSKRDPLEAAGRGALERVGGYLRGTAITSAVLAVAYAVFLTILGVPFVAPLAILTFLAGFIPYVGGIVAVVAALLVAWGSIGGGGTLILLALVIVANVLVRNFIRPTVYNRSVHLHPAVVLVALPIGSAIAGIVGLFAAVPVTAFVVAIAGALINALEPGQGRGEDRVVSGWVDRLAQWSWRILAAIAVGAVVLFLIGQAPLVVTPVVLAAIIAATVAPFAATLRERGWGANRAALAVTGGAFLGLITVIVVAIVQIGGQLDGAIRSAIEGSVRLSDGTDGSLAWVVALSETFGGALRGAIATVLQGIAAIGIIFVLAALLSFYFLRDGPRGWELILRRARPWQRPPLDEAGRESVGILGGYMFGTAVISAVGAITQLLIMVVLGLPFAIPIAVLSFIAAFIPYIGGFITTGLAFLIAVEFGTPPQVLIMFVFTIVINIVQGNIVTPLVYKRAVNLHPAVVLLAIPAGGAVAGIAGMFLAVPFLAVVATTWRTVLRVLGDAPATDPPMEQPEATGAPG